MAVSLLFFNTALASHYLPSIRIEDKKLFLVLEDVSAETSVLIQDQAGSIFLTEKVPVSGTYEHTFSLDELPSGAYALVVRSNNQETVWPITVAANSLTMDEEGRTTYLPTVLSQKRRHMQLSLLNPSRGTVSVFVFDKMGMIRYQDSMNDEPVIDKKFNLKQLPAGRYTVVVQNANRTFTRQLNLR